MDPLQLKGLLATPAPLPALAELCDGLGDDDRAAAIRSLNKKELKDLYDRAESPAARLDPSFFVPADVPPLTSVEWRGRNSLPLFKNFLKVMTRGPDGSIFGWNAASTAWAVGPGYFTIKPHPAGPQQVLFDYTELPATAPESWPRIKSNQGGMSYFVYRGLNDLVRPVGRHVVISAAFDGASGKMLGHYFALSRGPVVADSAAKTPAEPQAPAPPPSA